MQCPIIITNPYSGTHEKVLRFFAAKDIPYQLTKTQNELEQIVRSGKEFIVCGGDGTINRYLQSYMQLDPVTRSAIHTGFLPGGKANDFARMLGTPLKTEDAFNTLMKRRVKDVDVIQVNDKYFLTGGGMGFAVEVVQDVNAFVSTSGGRLISAYLKDLVYQMAAVTRACNYQGIEEVTIDGERECGLMMLTISNQPFIGKRFQLAPRAKHDDGEFDVTIIKRAGALGTILKLDALTKGKRPAETVYRKANELTVTTTERMKFMADGELLVEDTDFKIKIHPGAINVYY